MIFLTRVGCFLATMIFLGSILLGSPCEGQDETIEPPVTYCLEVDGVSHAIMEGKPLKLKGSLTNPTVTLHAAPYREFRFGGIEFPYPRHFTFEAEIDGPLEKTWTLSGNDFKIMYFMSPEDFSADQFADQMILQFGKKNSSKSKTTVTLGGEKRTGVRIQATVVGAKLTTDIFRLNAGKSGRLLVLQDSLDDTGRASKESQEAISLLQKSLRIK